MAEICTHAPVREKRLLYAAAVIESESLVHARELPDSIAGGIGSTGSGFVVEVVCREAYPGGEKRSESVVSVASRIEHFVEEEMVNSSLKLDRRYRFTAYKSGVLLIGVAEFSSPVVSREKIQANPTTRPVLVFELEVDWRNGLRSSHFEVPLVPGRPCGISTDLKAVLFLGKRDSGETMKQQQHADDMSLSHRHSSVWSNGKPFILKRRKAILRQDGFSVYASLVELSGSQPVR